MFSVIGSSKSGASSRSFFHGVAERSSFLQFLQSLTVKLGRLCRRASLVAGRFKQAGNDLSPQTVQGLCLAGVQLVKVPSRVVDGVRAFAPLRLEGDVLMQTERGQVLAALVLEGQPEPIH